MHNSQDSNDSDGDFTNFESIVDSLRALLKKACASAAKERKRADDLEKKLKKRGNQSDKTQKLKRQPIIKHSKGQADSLEEAIKAKDEEIEELHNFQKILEKINAENKETIDNLRKDVRQLNLELGTQRYMSGNSDDIEEIHKIYNTELKKLDEEIKELKENEDQWNEWPEQRKFLEDELEGLHEQIEELDASSNEWREKINEYEVEVDRLNSELNKRKKQANGDILFNDSAGLLMAGNGMSESDIDFIVQDNINELRDSHVRELGTAIPLEVVLNKKDNNVKRSNISSGKGKYIRELEELNRKNMDEIQYLKDRIEENKAYEDGDIYEEIEELKLKHQEEVRLLNDEIAKLKSYENGEFGTEVEDLKKEHVKEVNRLRCEIEEMKIFEDEDISKEVEELKRHHLKEVESLRKELEILRLNENGDIFEEVEELKKQHSDEMADLKTEIQLLKTGAPGLKNGEEIEDELNSLREEVTLLKNTDREKEWALLVDAKEREVDSLKNEIAFLKGDNNEGKDERWNKNPEDVPLMSNEINRLNGIIELMSKDYVLPSECPSTSTERPERKTDIVLDGTGSHDSSTKELKTLKLVGDDAIRAEIQKEHEEKMNSLLEEMFALKNIENEQIWKNAQKHIDKELEDIKKDFLAMANAKNADEWERAMQLYDEIRGLKSELLAKDNKESTEIARLREEVRYLKRELSNLKKANEHLITPKELDNKRSNSEERLHATNPFFQTNKEEYFNKEMPSVKGNEDEEMFNVEIRPLLEDIANLNNQVREAEEKLLSEKMERQNEVEALKKENSELRNQIPENFSDRSNQYDPNKAYTDDEKLANIVQELDRVQQLHTQADEKAADFERQLEEERSRYSEEMKKMADNLRNLKDSIEESEIAKERNIEDREEAIMNLKNALDDVKFQHEQEIQNIGEMCKEKTDALDDKISDLKISLGSRENELTKRVREIEELLEKIEGLEAEIDRLKEENENKLRKIDESEEIIKGLRSELEDCKLEVQRTLNEREKTYALYQQELGRVHIELLTTKSSHEEYVKEMEIAQKSLAEELVQQKEKLEEKFELLIQELKRTHEDEVDQIRIEMLSTHDKFKEYIIKMKNRQLSDNSVESIDEELSRIPSFDSDEKKSGDEQSLEIMKEKVNRSKSDSDIFGDEILFGDDGFESPPNMTMEPADDLDSGVRQNPGQNSRRNPFASRKMSREDRMTQSMDEIENPADNGRKDDRKLKNKKKNKSKQRSRDQPATFGADEETIDEVELKEKQKQCRQQ